MDHLEKTFKQMADRLEIDVSVRQEHQQALRKEMLAAYTQPSSNRLCGLRPVWSTIMRSNITKTAVAAIVIIAVLTGIYQIIGSIDGVTPAFAQVTAAMKKKSLMHFVSDDLWNGQKIKAEDWYSFDSKVEIHTIPNGDIVFKDFGVRQKQHYDLKGNVITVVTLDGEFPTDAPGAASPAEFLTCWYKHWTEIATDMNERKCSDTKSYLVGRYGRHNKKKAEIYELVLADPQTSIKFEIIADAQTHLPVYAKTVYTDSNGNIKRERDSCVDFPKEGPGNLYDVGAPRTAKVIDCTELELERLFASGNTEGLCVLFKTGNNEGKLAVVNYLSKIDTNQALETLKALDVSNLDEVIHETVKNRIEQLQQKLKKTTRANHNKLTQKQENDPNEVIGQDVSTPEEKTIAGADKADDVTGFHITIKVIEKESGNPLADANIRTYDGQSHDYTTDAQGVCVISRPGKGPSSINLFAAKDGYVGQSFSCGEGRFVDVFPEDVIFSLEKGTVIGGIVTDSEGIPIGGANVHFSINDGDGISKEPETDVRFEQTTDSQGRWVCTSAPKELAWVTIDVDYPDYARSHVYANEPEAIEQLRSQTYVITMDQGYTIEGFVRDETGHPVNGAQIQLGRYYWYKDAEYRTHADEAGHFEFRRLAVTSRIQTVYEDVEGQGTIPVRRPVEFVTVSSEGYAPQMVQVVFREKQANLEFVMTPGSPLYGRVVDPEGGSVVGATVRADNWAAESWDRLCTIDWTVKTDAEGRFVWEHAPIEAIALKITQDAYMVLETEKVSPSDAEYEFVLNPKVRVFGRVVDAVTKEPVPAFTFRRYEGGYIKTPQQVNDADGKFSTAFADQGETFTIGFEADGYKPVRSREISLIEQNVELVIEMTPDAGIDGIVVDAAGHPLEGVRVIIPISILHLENMKYDISQLQHHQQTHTDAEGHFHLAPPLSDKYSILALEDAGYLYVHSADFPANGVFVLQPYAKIVGDYYKGRRPAANERIRIDYPNYHFNGLGNLSVTYGVETDEHGTFEFDRLIAGVVRILVDPYREVEVKAGQTYQVCIGGDGLTVTGRLLNPDGEPLNDEFGCCSMSFRRIYDSLPIPENEWPLPENADVMTFGELSAWYTQFGSGDEAKEWLAAMEEKYGELEKRYTFKSDHNGRFEVPNVTPGMYLFTVEVRAWQDAEQYPRQADYTRFLAKGSKVFTVDEFETAEQMDVPVDLGVVQCRTAPLAIGMNAPDFLIHKLQGTGTIQLSDYQGKTVLVNFVNPALDDRESENAAALATICELAKGQGNVAVINVAVETIPWDFMRQKMIPECTLSGVYGVAQQYNSQICADYEVNELPVSFLIDPAGIILWRGTPRAELQDLLNSVLMGKRRD